MSQNLPLRWGCRAMTAMMLLALASTVRGEATAIDLDTAALQALLEERPEAVVIDVRTRHEINQTGGRIDSAHAMVIPRGWLEFRIESAVPDRTRPVVVYCGRNERSPLAAQTLAEMGYQAVYNYVDGYFRWRDAGLPVERPDAAPESVLYARAQEVIPGVWSAIGATAPPTYENSGHNNNLSFIVTDEGVVVINAGDNYLLAWALHQEIKAVTDQPVRYVVLENGQGHAMLGSSYWVDQGVPIIAHSDAAREIEHHGAVVLERMRQGRRDKAIGTRLVEPDVTFQDAKVLELGGRRIELLYLGPAHSPGDIVVWLPASRLVISGDMAFHERLLPVFEDTDTRAWLETWERFEALGAEHVIPGHGGPTTMAPVRRDTKGYLAYMRDAIGQLIDEGGGLLDAYAVDQSAYAHLDTFDELARQNAGRIFREMEFQW